MHAVVTTVIRMKICTLFKLFTQTFLYCKYHPICETNKNNNKDS